MRKLVFGVLTFAVCFLMYFSVYRALNGGEPLTLQAFLNHLNILDFQFDNLYNYTQLTFNEWERFIEIFNEPFIYAYDLQSFFALFQQLVNKFNAFFNLVGTAITVLFGFLFDFIELFVSFVKLILTMLGIVPQA